ncbi:MAG: CvpA family protein [Lachnospiraceae bacterium]|nr:CvpA family protein [Lachnospiraceae bacterium]
MKKGKILTGLGVMILLFIYYYISLPAINIHSSGLWGCILFLIVLFTGIFAFRKYKKDYRNITIKVTPIEFIKSMKILKVGIGLFVAVVAVYVVGSILSSPIVNASRYQKLLTVEEGDFATDVEQVDFRTIPILDKDSAELLGNRKMGSMVEMVSQFEVGNDYTQINYQGTPVRVTPLVYASGIKWLTNQKDGIPAYIMIDMATQDTQCVKLSEGMKYSKSEHFNRNIYRHLRFRYPTYIFADQIFFEIDDEGTPYWVCPVKKYKIGLFGGQTIGNVVLCNAVTGECTDYPVEDVPTWVDKVYSAELLTELYDYYGTLKHGYFNSVLSQKDCLQATNGYNYIALDDDVWVYTGVTSVSGDQSNVGFVLMNQRTMETKFYKVEGAIEDSAMTSAEGQVQNLGYVAAFPLLLNISDEPTYFMALKDGGGLVKKYAMVNVQKYQWVAIGDTVKECEQKYLELLKTNGIGNGKNDATADLYQTATGTITAIAPIVTDGNTHYYVALQGRQKLFDLDMSETSLLDIIRYQVGEQITFSYSDGEGELYEVKEIAE